MDEAEGTSGTKQANGPPQQADPLVGSLLGDRYRVERKLGAGGMGSVYLATHERTGRRCAIKVLAREFIRDEDSVVRFQREARALGRLGHPSIVGIHDFYETDDGVPYLAMDYLEGEDLARRLSGAGPLSWARARPIFSQMAAALEAAHSEGILHRDLKPGNVFLASHSSVGERVVLLDFGLAKTEDDSRLTRSGAVMGTPSYMSPEQARGDALDVRADVYSAAAVLYEMLSGRPPFVGRTVTAVIAKLITEPAPALSDVCDSSLPAHLEGVLQKALAKKPEERYATIADLAQAALQERPSWAAPIPPTRAAAPGLEQTVRATGPVPFSQTRPAPPSSSAQASDPSAHATGPNPPPETGPAEADLQASPASPAPPAGSVVAAGPREASQPPASAASVKPSGRRELVLAAVIGALAFALIGVVGLWWYTQSSEPQKGAADSAGIDGKGGGADSSNTSVAPMPPSAPFPPGRSSGDDGGTSHVSPEPIQNTEQRVAATVSGRAANTRTHAHASFRRSGGSTARTAGRRSGGTTARTAGRRSGGSTARTAGRRSGGTTARASGPGSGGSTARASGRRSGGTTARASGPGSGGTTARASAGARSPGRPPRSRPRVDVNLSLAASRAIRDKEYDKCLRLTKGRSSSYALHLRITCAMLGKRKKTARRACRKLMRLHPGDKSQWRCRRILNLPGRKSPR